MSRCPAPPPVRPPVRPSWFRPRVEALEGRCVPASRFDFPALTPSLPAVSRPSHILSVPGDNTHLWVCRGGPDRAD